MNPHTGAVYVGSDEIDAARERGEPLVTLDGDQADVETLIGHAQAAIAKEKAKRRAANKAARASRKANR